jgi:exopolyphosphatase/guanosine-5'-triphosphate,3'-diphosphate pyrophosphatase
LGPTSGCARRRLAAIDIGTNTVLLTVVEVDADGGVSALLERETITRLGERVDEAGRLAPGAVERTLACLQRYRRDLDDLGVSRVGMVGTSAMRDARGADSFRAEAARIVGATPRVLSGAEEASLTFRGATTGLGLGEATVTVFDIGGGSTEVVRGRAEPARIEASVSMDIGSVRLTERHVRSDPPRSEELDAVDEAIRSCLAAASPPLPGADYLVGVAGTVTTLAAVVRGVDPFDAARVLGTRLSLREVEEVGEMLARLDGARRKAVAGMVPERADVIVAGARLCAAVMRAAGATSVIVSDRGVRWGLIWAMCEASPAKFDNCGGYE